MRIQHKNTEIITNNKPRNFIHWYDLTPKEQKEFDWMDEETADQSQFFRYRNNVYYIGDFMRETGFAGFDAAISDTFFSGIVIKIVYDIDKVIVGRYYSK